MAHEGEKVNRKRLIEAFAKIFLWVVAIIINIMYISGLFEHLPEELKRFIITGDVSMVVILLWFMPSTMAERRLKKGLEYLDRDNDKAVRYIEAYLDSKMLTLNERKHALRVLGVAHHKRGDDAAAIKCLTMALEGNYKDNDLKVEILGAMGVIYSESGEFQKAAECFDRTFEIMFAMSKANIDKAIFIQVINTYIKTGQKEKALMIYDRLLMIQGFTRDKRVEEILGI